MLAIDLIANYLVVNWLCIKIANKKNKEFATKTKAKLVVLEIIEINEIDGVDESDRINKYKEIALS